MILPSVESHTIPELSFGDIILYIYIYIYVLNDCNTFDYVTGVCQP